MSKLLDSSAVLAFLRNERGAESVRAELPGGLISAVNAAEVLTVLVRNSIPLEEARRALLKTRLEVVDFTLEHAVGVAGLQSPELRRHGISLGDRACMAAGLQMDLPVITADRDWAGLRVPGLRVVTVR